MLKNLPEEGDALLTLFIQQFWEDNDCDFVQWHKTKVLIINKKKGNALSYQLEKNMSKEIHSKNNKCNTHQKTPQKP